MTAKSGFKSTRRAVALEPRLLFDGAGAVAAFDAAVDNGEDKSQEHSGAAPASYDEGAAEKFQTRFFAAFASEQDGADVKITDTLGAGKTAIVGEDDTTLDLGLELKGDGEYTVTITSEKGKITDSPKTGAATEINKWLASLGYNYTGGSETGDTDTLILTIIDEQGGTTTLERELQISPQNDAPVIKQEPQGPNDEHIYDRLKVNEGGEVSFDSVKELNNGKGGDRLGAYQSNIGLYDPDNLAEQIIIKINTMPEQGKLYLGDVELAAGAALSLDEIGQLKYKHDGSQVLAEKTVSFKITVDDGAGGLIKEQDVFIDLLPVNDAPVISGKDSLVIIQGEGAVNLGTGGTLPVISGNRGQLVGTDADDKYDQVDNLTYEISELPQVGKLYYDGVEVTAPRTIENLAFLTYEYPADLEPKDIPAHGTITQEGDGPKQVVFKIRVTDAGGGEGEDKKHSIEEVISITILDNNNDPFFDPDQSGDWGVADNGAIIVGDVIEYETYEPKAGNTITLTPEMLPLQDKDSFDANLVFTLKDNNHSKGGYFTLNVGTKENPDLRLLDNNGLKEASFSYQDVLDGKVQYHFFGNNIEDHIDYIDFTVQDSAITIIFPEGGGRMSVMVVSTLMIVKMQIYRFFV